MDLVTSKRNNQDFFTVFKQSLHSLKIHTFRTFQGLVKTKTSHRPLGRGFTTFLGNKFSSKIGECMPNFRQILTKCFKDIIPLHSRVGLKRNIFKLLYKKSIDVERLTKNNWYNSNKFALKTHNHNVLNTIYLTTLSTHI